MKRAALDKISSRPDFDSVEEVAFWHDPDTGVWQWQYTLYDLETRRYLGRRIGQLELSNPKVGEVHLRRALINDQHLGAFIPDPEQWERPGTGEEAGWVFRQKQHLSRAQRIADTAGGTAWA